LYVWVGSITEIPKITIIAVYNDRTYSSKKLEIENQYQWNRLIFAGFLKPNKYIVQIQIELSYENADDIDNYIYIDDIGLWLSQPSTYKRFEFMVSPNPISISSLSFTAYGGQNYLVSFTVYNLTSGQPDENGTFQVVFGYVDLETGQQTTSGNIVNGRFNFTINARSPFKYITENIGVTMYLPDEVISITITAYWLPSAEGEGEEEIDVDAWSTNIAGLIIPFMFMFFPAMLLGAKLGMSGFLGGMILGVVALYIAGLIPVWILFILALGIAYLLFKGLRNE